MVKRQLLEHFLHLDISLCIPKLSNCSSFKNLLSYPFLYLFFDIIAQPKAPIIPAISGLITSRSDNISNALRTASL